MDKWNEFLKSGKVEDYLDFKNQSRLEEADRHGRNAQKETEEDIKNTSGKSRINGDYYG